MKWSVADRIDWIYRVKYLPLYFCLNLSKNYTAINSIIKWGYQTFLRGFFPTHDQSCRDRFNDRDRLIDRSNFCDRWSIDWSDQFIRIEIEIERGWSNRSRLWRHLVVDAKSFYINQMTTNFGSSESRRTSRVWLISRLVRLQFQSWNFKAIKVQEWLARVLHQKITLLTCKY